MRMKGLSVLALCGALLLAAGCNKTAAKMNTAPFKTALNAYYQSHPACAFREPMKFPMTISPEGKQPSPADLQRLNALVDAGLLSKETKKEWVDHSEGGHHIRVHEDADSYNLTDKGKSAWTAEASGGNFCYATPQVTSIDHYSPEPNNTRYGVSYNYSVGSLPSWTRNAKVQAAFPSLAAASSSGQTLTGLATLSKTSSGWKASGITSITSVPVPQENQNAQASNGNSGTGGK